MHKNMINIIYRQKIHIKFSMPFPPEWKQDDYSMGLIPHYDRCIGGGTKATEIVGDRLY